MADHHAAAFQPSVGASVTDSGVETKKIIAGVEFSIHVVDENLYMVGNTF